MATDQAPAGPAPPFANWRRAIDGSLVGERAGPDGRECAIVTEAGHVFITLGRHFPAVQVGDPQEAAQIRRAARAAERAWR